MPKCDAVVGPGNKYVTAAKQLIAGRATIGILISPLSFFLLLRSLLSPLYFPLSLLVSFSLNFNRHAGRPLRVSGVGGQDLQPSSSSRRSHRPSRTRPRGPSNRCECHLQFRKWYPLHFVSFILQKIWFSSFSLMGKDIVQAIEEELQKQLATLPTADVARQAIQANGVAVVVKGIYLFPLLLFLLLVCQSPASHLYPSV